MKNIIRALVFSCILFITMMPLITPPSWAQGQPVSDILDQLGNSNASSSTDIVSMVDNVSVTKFDILSLRHLGVDLRYSGTGDAPAVKVDADAIHIDSKLAEDIANEINVLNASSSDFNQALTTNSTNSTSLMDEKLDLLTSIVSESNGTITTDAGWKSPSSFVIKLTGNTTLNDANIIGIIVSK